MNSLKKSAAKSKRYLVLVCSIMLTTVLVGAPVLDSALADEELFNISADDTVQNEESKAEDDLQGDFKEGEATQEQNDGEASLEDESSAPAKEDSGATEERSDVPEDSNVTEEENNASEEEEKSRSKDEPASDRVVLAEDKADPSTEEEEDERPEDGDDEHQENGDDSKPPTPDPDKDEPEWPTPEEVILYPQLGTALGIPFKGVHEFIGRTVDVIEFKGIRIAEGHIIELGEELHEGYHFTLEGQETSATVTAELLSRYLDINIQQGDGTTKQVTALLPTEDALFNTNTNRSLSFEIIVSAIEKVEEGDTDTPGDAGTSDDAAGTGGADDTSGSDDDDGTGGNDGSDDGAGGDDGSDDGAGGDDGSDDGAGGDDGSDDGAGGDDGSDEPDKTYIEKHYAFTINYYNLSLDSKGPSFAGEVSFGDDVFRYANEAGLVSDYTYISAATSSNEPLKAGLLSDLLPTDSFDVFTCSLGEDDDYPQAGESFSFYLKTDCLSSDYAQKIRVIDSSIDCKVIKHVDFDQEVLFSNYEGKRLVKDKELSLYWTNTKEVIFQDYKDVKVGGRIVGPKGTLKDLDESFFPGSALTVPFNTRGIPRVLYASNNHSENSVTNNERLLSRLLPIRCDGQAPQLVDVSLKEPDFSYGAIYGYRQDIAIALEVEDVAQWRDKDKEDVSGITSVEISYGEGTTKENYEVKRNPNERAPFTFSDSYIELFASDTPYYLDTITLTTKDVAQNSQTISLKDYFTYQPNISLHTIIIDNTPPQAALSLSPQNDSGSMYYKEDREALITVSEAHFDILTQMSPRPTIATITKNHVHTTNITADRFDYNKATGLWEFKETFGDEGHYELVVDFKDFVGNPLLGGPKRETFVIDKTDPAIMVTFDNDDFHRPFYYSAPRQATIQIAEQNFDPSLVSIEIQTTDALGNLLDSPGHGTWINTHEGRHETTIYFGGEHHYSFRVGAMDAAGNAAEPFVVEEFVIDMTAPQITIENIAHTQAFSKIVEPHVSFFDQNLEGFSATVDIKRASGEAAYHFGFQEELSDTTKTYAYQDLEYTLRNDDVYILTARIVDKAGNEAEEICMFSVNRFGSTYLFSPSTQAMAGAFLTKPQEVVVTEINASGLIEKETNIRVSANDGVSTLMPAIDYFSRAVVDESLWHSQIYTIPADQFQDDGFYRVMFRSIDRAGNLSENTMGYKNSRRDASAELAFAIDATFPLGSIYNIESNETHSGAYVDADIRLSDNLALDYALVLIDGKEALRYDAEGIETSYTETLRIHEGKEAQDISLVIFDRAGNTTTIEKKNVLITPSLKTLITKTPVAKLVASSPLFGLALGALIVALASALWFLVIAPLLRRKKRREKEAKLTFKKPA